MIIERQVEEFGRDPIRVWFVNSGLHWNGISIPVVGICYFKSTAKDT
jgi:hypothetical protein